MNDVRCPAQLLDGFEDSAGEEYRALGIVSEECAVVVATQLFSLEIILIVTELHLDACSRYGRNLDYERPVYIIDDDVHAREPYNLVKLVFALVDTAVAWHE